MKFLTGVVESQLLDNSTTENFKPFPLVEDFNFETRRREGEEGLNPTNLKRHISRPSTKQFQQKAVGRELEV
jgi:hypothetical protein